MTDSDIDTLIKDATNEALISYVSVYYSMKLNKDLAVKCMLELDKRRTEGQEINYEEEIKAAARVMESVGKGFIVQAKSDIDLTVKHLRLIGIPAIVVDRSTNDIQIPEITPEQKAQIEKLPEVLNVQPDSARSKISAQRENS